MPLFQDDAQLKACLPMTADAKLSQFTKYLDRAGNEWARRWLGLPLTAAILAGTAPAPVLELARPAFAAKAYRLFAPVGAVQLTSAGVQQFEGKQLKAPTSTQTGDLKEQLEADAWDGMDALLAYLEANAADFPEWAGTRYDTRLVDGFIRNLDEFEEFISLENSRLRFVLVLPPLRHAGRSIIRPLLGPALYDELLAAQDDTAHAPLVALIRTALANLSQLDDALRTTTATEALDELVVELNRDVENYPNFKDSPRYWPETVNLNDAAFGFWSGL